MTFPSVVEYARKWPSFEPENTAPGIAETACDCAGLHGVRLPQEAGAVIHLRSPLSARDADMSPPRCWSGLRAVALRAGEPMFDRATSIRCPSAASPHCI